MIASLRSNIVLLALVVAYTLAVNLAVFYGNMNALLGCFTLTGFLFLAYALVFAKNILFPATLFLIPVSFFVETNGVRLDFPSELLTGLLTFVFLLHAVRKPVLLKKVLSHPVTWLLFIELGWMIVASLSSTLPAVSLKRCIVRFCFLAVFYLLGAHWFEDRKKRAWFFILYAAGAVVPVIYAIAKHAHYDFNTEVAYAMCQPFFSDHTIYGASLAFIIPGLFILLFNRRRFGFSTAQTWGITLLTLVIVAGEVLAFSRAAWISLLGAMLFYFLIRLRIRLWVLIAGMAVLSVTVYTYRAALVDQLRRNEAVSNKGSLVEHVQSVTNVQTDASNMERINRWNAALRMTADRPVSGFGPGTYQFVYGSYQVRPDMTTISTFSGNRGNAHSEYFTALSETGYPGLLLFLTIMFTVIGYGLRVIYRTHDRTQRNLALAALLGLITFYVHGIFNSFLDSDKMGALVFCAIAVIVITDATHRKGTKGRGTGDGGRGRREK